MMLTRFAEDVWVEPRLAKFWGVETGTRMTLVRLSDGGLFVHSPVALDAQTRSEVDALGPVRAVVSPSIFHHLHVGDWLAAYPDAVYAACPGLEWKRPDLAVHVRARRSAPPGRGRAISSRSTSPRAARTRSSSSTRGRGP